ncbi:hypothetical protein GCM10010182_35620 [Actinomadura cremea]|nr:hypothetical protein GCM10010182_35620 [Actinomadura cremea]
MSNLMNDFQDDPIDLSSLTLGQLEDLPGSSIALALREVLDPALGEIAAAGFDSYAPPMETAKVAG